MTRLSARLPQERVDSFVIDVSMVTNRVVVDILLNLQNCTPCTRSCRAGGQGRAGFASGDGGTQYCHVRWTGVVISGLGGAREGQLSRAY